MTHRPNRFYESSIKDFSHCCCQSILSNFNKELYNKCQRTKNNQLDEPSQGLTLVTKKPNLRKQPSKP